MKMKLKTWFSEADVRIILTLYPNNQFMVRDLIKRSKISSPQLYQTLSKYKDLFEIEMDGRKKYISLSIKGKKVGRALSKFLKLLEEIL